MLIIDKSIETGSRLMVARVWGGGGMLVAANGHEFEGNENVLELDGADVFMLVNMLNST